MRNLDLVLYGATGVVGRQAAAYLAAHAPAGLRWAAGGRDRSGLDKLNLRVPLLVADARDAQQLDELAAQTRVVLNVAGPFRRYGDPLVDACIRQRTHYCDISGETARIRDLIDRRHAEAERAGVRVVPFCGASSAPVDVAAFLLARRLGGGTLHAKAVLRLEGGSFSGGTIASMGEAVDSGDAVREADPLFLLGPEAGRSPTPPEHDPKAVRWDRDLGLWTIPSPLGVSDTRAVRRSAALEHRDVVIQEYLGFDRLGPAVATWSALAGFRTAVRLRPTRRLLSKAVGAEPPTRAKPDAASYTLRLVGTADGAAGAEVRVSGAGEAGGRITVLCAVASALALATEEAALPRRFGVLTPSVALGDPLVGRLSGRFTTVPAIRGSSRA